MKFSKALVSNTIDTPIIVLIYHRVTNLVEDPQMLAVSPQNFREQLIFIKNNFSVLRSDDDWSSVKKPSVIITFDDGYADNFKQALPILEDLEIPATFFVSSGYLNSKNEFWWDEIEKIILMTKNIPDYFNLNYSNLSRNWIIKNYQDRLLLYNDLISLMKTQNSTFGKYLIEYLRNWSNKPIEVRTTHKPMSLKEINDMAQSPYATIGAHTVNHLCLSNEDLNTQKFEIEVSKKTLESLINKEVKTFSYPFGEINDYSLETIKIIKEAGLQKSFSNFRGQCHTWTDQYQIPRNLIRNWDLQTFKYKFKRFWYV